MTTAVGALLATPLLQVLDLPQQRGVNRLGIKPRGTRLVSPVDCFGNDTLPREGVNECETLDCREVYERRRVEIVHRLE